MDLIISDDISETNIEFKGDGIKSLLSIALLQNSPVNDVTEFLAIDEPEAHLHPGAIRKLNSTLNDISKKQQVIISTHNPILINTDNISSNIIINNGSVKKAKNLKEIREILGIGVADNLIDSNYLLLVEGPTDEALLKKALSSLSPSIKSLLSSSSLRITNTGGTKNLKNSLYIYQSMIAKTYVFLDNDSAATTVISECTDQKLLTNNYMFIPTDINVPCKKAFQLEDLHPFELVISAVKSVDNIDISKYSTGFKNVPFSEKMNTIYNNEGKKWNLSKDKVKSKISESIMPLKNVDDYLTPHGIKVFKKLSENLLAEFKTE